MTEVLVTSVLEEALRLFSDKIAKKLAEGKRLTDSEITVLLLDQMNKRMEIMNQSLNKRIDDLRDSLNARIDETNKRIDELRESMDVRMNELRDSLNARIDETNKRIDDLRDSLSGRINELREEIRTLQLEVSSIKSDIINLMKEKILK